MLNLETQFVFDEKLLRSPNLVPHLSERDAAAIAREVIEGYNHDRASRAQWERRNEAAMKLALQLQEQKTFPWPGAANVIFPLVTIAALQFHSEAAPAVLSSRDIVKYTVRGDADRPTLERAQRVAAHMSWQVFEEDLGWLDDHDRLLLNLAIVGTAFTKSYYSPRLRVPVAEFVPAVDFLVDYGARSIEEMERGTHIIPLHRNRIWERCAQGLYSDVREEAWFLGNAPLPIEGYTIERDRRQGVSMSIPDRTTRWTGLEQHLGLDLDGDGYEEPYIATVALESRRLLRLIPRVARVSDIVRDSRGRLLRIIPEQYFTRFTFLPSADNGFYGEGFGKLLGPINEAVSTGVNQLLDFGTVQNSFGGFLGRGAKIRGGVYTMAPWEWKRVDSTGDDLRKNLVPFPEKSPPTVMFQLLSLLIDYSNRIAGTTDPMVGENPGQNTPASTFQGMQEQGRKIYRMIFQRVWRALRDEYRKRYELNAQTLELQESFGPERQGQFIRKEDYSGDPGRIAPTADPNQPSAVMQLQQAMALKQDSLVTPGYDREEVTRRFIKALGVEDVAKVFPGADKVPPLPNPKLQVEQGKIQMKQMELRAKQFEFVHQMQLQRAEVAAKVELMKVQAAKLIHDMGAERAALELEAFEKAIDGLNEHNKLLNERISGMLQSMGGSGDDSSEKSPQPGGVGSLAGASGDKGVQGGAGGLGGGLEGAMGGGGLSDGGLGGGGGGELPSGGGVSPAGEATPPGS